MSRLLAFGDDGLQSFEPQWAFASIAAGLFGRAGPLIARFDPFRDGDRPRGTTVHAGEASCAAKRVYHLRLIPHFIECEHGADAASSYASHASAAFALIYSDDPARQKRLGRRPSHDASLSVLKTEPMGSLPFDSNQWGVSLLIRFAVT